jgi:hypothetical protein
MRERRLGLLTVAKQSQIESSYAGIAANSATLAIYEGTRQNRTVLCAKAGVPCGSRLAKTVRSAVFSRARTKKDGAREHHARLF